MNFKLFIKQLRQFWSKTYSDELKFMHKHLSINSKATPLQFSEEKVIRSVKAYIEENKL